MTNNFDLFEDYKHLINPSLLFLFEKAFNIYNLFLLTNDEKYPNINKTITA